MLNARWKSSTVRIWPQISRFLSLSLFIANGCDTQGREGKGGEDGFTVFHDTFAITLCSKVFGYVKPRGIDIETVQLEV